ncbi:MAG: hypothetical protein U0401_06215 [Anaerolineae bacterium]
MSDNAVGMGAQDSAEREKFEHEVKRITEAAQSAGLMLRLLGSLAFQVHCPHYGFLQAKLGRAYTDIDFGGYAKQSRSVRELLSKLGYAEDREIFVVTEGSRAIFENPTNGLHVDVFYDKLDFCHVIRWEGRLEADWPTIPLAELLLEKMQIVKINEKDLIDTIMLFLEHPLGDSDAETINMTQVARLCAADWGLWRTTTMNLAKVRQIADLIPSLPRNRNSISPLRLRRLWLDSKPNPSPWPGNYVPA